MIRAMKKIISSVVDWMLYTVLSEQRKEKLASLFSERQKETIRKITKHGKRRKQKLYVKQIKDNLYSLGLRSKSLTQLESIRKETNDTYMKRLVAWELVLWYANMETEKDAQKSLTYINDAKVGEKDSQQLRRIAIVEAECFERIGKTAEATNVIEDQLALAEHPDLFLAMANLTDDISERLQWINKVYQYYHLHPITFSSLNEPTYDDLEMVTRAAKVNEETKVTVILPAFNAGEGIRIAIESILSQTWENIELIVVDDCSSDHTVEIVKEYVAKDNRVILLSTPENSGPYVARNIALQQATGDFITVNDADDWSHEKKLEIQARHLLNNPQIVANTSAHARLTEKLRLYRRGTPGRYIFPNMSSIMFRREEVVNKLGHWDSVRFAADGEFKRRLLRAFGEAAFVDLASGPLSLPRQSVSSLTASPAFGYIGFFMGARKEYVESFTHYYETGNDLFYPYPIKKRFFPVPEPMWPSREEKIDGVRSFDIVIAGDFRKIENEETAQINVLRKFIGNESQLKIGLVQMYQYNLAIDIEIAPEIRSLIQQSDIQMLVFGEKIDTEKLLVINYNGLLDEQNYIPDIYPEMIELLVGNDENIKLLAEVHDTLQSMYGKAATIIPTQQNVRKKIMSNWKEERPFQLAEEDWVL